jgi:hypothetical protein
MGGGRVKNAKKPARREKTDLSGPWPDRPATAWPGMTVRDEVDYLVWIAETAEAVGFHGGDSVGRWRDAVQSAYDALVDPMVSEHGDPLPPDVPPAQRPGTWPDVPAARIPGMTIRHQLTVLRTMSGLCRAHAGVHHHPTEAQRWAERVQRAFDALHHGPDLPMPDSARTKSAAETQKEAAAKARASGRGKSAGKAEAASVGKAERPATRASDGKAGKGRAATPKAPARKSAKREPSPRGKRAAPSRAARAAARKRK